MNNLKMLLRFPIGLFAALLYFITMLSVPLPILFFAGIRALLPKRLGYQKLTNIVENSALLWTDVNHFILRKLLPIEWHIIGQDKVVAGKNYLVIANHQSWVDIPVLEEALYKKSGFSRYFIKKNLLHIPLTGWACRALHFPYMYRYGKEFLAKHPECKGRDIEVTKKACRKLKDFPFKLNSFTEGTRFTVAKHDRQQSPYQHLLNPRAGGLSYALQALSEDFYCILNLTIVYVGKPKNLIGFFLGGINKIYVYVEPLPITPDLLGDYQTNREFRVKFQAWLNGIWQKKDQQIAEIYQREKE